MLFETSQIYNRRIQIIAQIQNNYLWLHKKLSCVRMEPKVLKCLEHCHSMFHGKKKTNLFDIHQLWNLQFHVNYPILIWKLRAFEIFLHKFGHIVLFLASYGFWTHPIHFVREDGRVACSPINYCVPSPSGQPLLVS